MNARQILEDYLLIGKRVTLEFPSLSDVQSFKSMLYSYKSRMNKQLAALTGDAEDIFSNRSILTSTQVQPDGSVHVSFELGKRETEVKFKIISTE
jgi:hypothetical protein